MIRAPSLASADRNAVQRGGLPSFVELALRAKLGTGYLPGRHLTVLSEAFERLYYGETEVLITNLPPGVGKSRVASIYGPAWIWTLDPTYVFMCASYDDGTMRSLAEVFRDLLASEWFQDRWGDILIAGEALSEMWTTSDGFRLGTTVQGGRGIGRHCNMYVIDDPNKTGSADVTPKQLTNAHSWFDSRVKTRARPGHVQKIVVNQQRLHDEDLTGYVQEQYKGAAELEHVILPFYAEAGVSSEHDWRKEGEILWPEDKTQESRARAHARSKGGIQGAAFRGPYQQDPKSGTDKIFRAETFLDFTGAPAFEETISAISIDPTFTGKSTSDKMAIEVWGWGPAANSRAGIDEAWCYYSEAIPRGFLEALEAIVQIRRKWPATFILIEESANGFAIIETLKQKVTGIIPVKPKGSKPNRARAASYLFGDGTPAVRSRVHFDKSKPWYAEKAKNLIRFPNGSNDDDVDTTSQVLLYFQEQFGHQEAFAGGGSAADPANPDAAVAELDEARDELGALGFHVDFGSLGF